MPWPVRRNVRPGWVPGRDRQEDAALERLDRDLRAEEGFLEGQRQLALEVGAAAGERPSGRTLDDDDEVAAARVLAGQLDPACRCRRRAGS